MGGSRIWKYTRPLIKTAVEPEQRKKTDINRISVILSQLFFHVKLDNRLHFSVNFNILFPIYFKLLCPSLTAPYKPKLLLLVLVSGKLGCDTAALPCQGGCVGLCGQLQLREHLPVCPDSGLQLRNPWWSREHTPSGKMQIQNSCTEWGLVSSCWASKAWGNSEGTP